MARVERLQQLPAQVQVYQDDVIAAHAAVREAVADNTTSAITAARDAVSRLLANRDFIAAMH